MEGDYTVNKVKKNPALLYLGRFQADYLADGATQSIRFPFKADVVRDLEVINTAALSEQIKAWVAQYKIIPADLTILLADDLLFSKVITVPDPKSREDAINTFIDAVPFEETAVVQVPFQGSVAVSVANKSYYDAFKKAFEALGFSIVLVLPAFLLNKEINLAKSQDTASFNLALKKADTYRQYSLLSQIQHPPVALAGDKEKGEPKKNMRLFLLLGLFGLLILILIGVFVMTQNQATPEVTNSSQSGVSSQEIAISPIEEVEMIDTIKVVYRPQTTSPINSVISALQNVGVTNIASESGVISTTSAAIIFFAPAVSEDTRGVLVREIQKVIPSLIVGEDSSASEEATLEIN